LKSLGFLSFFKSR